jgi:hypothetical protein
MKTPNRDQANAGPPFCARNLTLINGRKDAFGRSPFRFQPSTTAVMLTLVPMLAGCASHQIGPARPFSIDNDVAMVYSLANPSDLSSFASDPVKRNDMVTARMYVADMQYQVYEANLTKEIQDEGLLGTAAVLGLTTSSTLVGAAATKTILSGIATGVAGLDKAYNEKELLSNAMQALQTQMRADRNAQAAQIYARMFTDVGNNVKRPTPIGEYTMAMALSDTETYYQAGTLTSALVGLSKTTARAAENAAAAKAEAGPNARAVMVAQDMASPISRSSPPPGLAPLTKEQVRSSRISNPTSTITTIPHSAETRKTARELFIFDVKAALCVPEKDPSLSPATESAIADYLRAMNQPVPKRIEPYFDPNLQPFLGKAINYVKDCKAQGFETPYEVGAFGVPAGVTDNIKDFQSDNIKELQSKINDKLRANESSTTIKETGSFDTDTRDAIQELRERQKLPPGRQIDRTLDKYLNSVHKK